MKSIPFITFTPEVERASPDSCFWTDFVACVEDCDGAPPPPDDPVPTGFQNTYTQLASGPTRYTHTAVAIAGKMYVFGGFGGPKHVMLGDLWGVK